MIVRNYVRVYIDKLQFTHICHFDSYPGTDFETSEIETVSTCNLHLCHNRDGNPCVSTLRKDLCSIYDIWG